MENFIFSLNATIPIFLIIILGWALMQIGLFNKEFTTVADKYVFKVALPVLVFLDIATADIYKMFNLKFVLFCAIGTTLMFLGVWLFAHWYCKDKSMVGAFTQAAARGSAAILGIAFVENIYGNSGMAPMMIVSAVPLYNIFSVVILTFSAANAEGTKRHDSQGLHQCGKKSDYHRHSSRLCFRLFQNSDTNNFIKITGQCGSHGQSDRSARRWCHL